MATGLPRARRHSAPLVRALAELADTELADAGLTFGEHLGQWLAWTDAISLSAALASGGSTPPTPARPGAASAARAVAQEIARVRSKLAMSITTDALFAPPQPGAAERSAADFTPYRRGYLAHQAAMDASIPPLRATLRAALAQHSAALGQLAALDGVMDQALAARERQALAGVPGLLAQRFKRLHQQHPEPLVACHQEMQSALLAELALRLEPIEGMLEALSQASPPDPHIPEDARRP